VTKIFYVGYIFVIPVLFTSLAWWQILIGIFIMHYLAGFILAIIFQPAHVIEGTSYPSLDENRGLENNWAVHQLLTTTNFGNGSRWFSWYVGGLNFQIEHHLFPRVCHTNYPAISKIVEQTCREFNVNYREHVSFRVGIASHFRWLRRMGAPPVAA